MKKRILFIFGTRPEAIKLAPLIKTLQKDSYFDVHICLTSQHKKMLSQVVDFFEIKGKFNLKIMKPGQNLHDITINVLKGLKSIIVKVKPHLVVVQGDTTTTFTAALAAFYQKVPIAHVEAGLRTNRKYLPFPEEVNRRLVSSLADIHLASTVQAKENLRKEGVKNKLIFVTGNTIIDALFFTLRKVKKTTPSAFDGICSNLKGKKVILVTGHRRESFGKAFKSICLALKDISIKHPNVIIIYPVHLNPNVQKPVYNILKNVDNVYLLEPISYPEFVWLINKSYFIVTDSGGVQEEAPSLGKPVLVIREVTERPEGVKRGVAKLVGTDRREIANNISSLVTNEKHYRSMSKRMNIYGDGKASIRIKNIFKKYLSSLN